MKKTAVYKRFIKVSPQFSHFFCFKASQQAWLAKQKEVVGMPLKRRVFKVGTSRVVALPSDWLKYVEEKLGKSIEEVLIEVNDNIKITPA